MPAPADRRLGRRRLRLDAEAGDALVPPNQFALASGIALFCGVCGVVAGVPLRLLVESFGWRPVMVVTAIVTAALCLAIFLFVRDDPSERGYASHAPVPAMAARIMVPSGTA